jgi:hypothetical protein
MLRPAEQEPGFGVVRIPWKSQSNGSREMGEFRPISNMLEHAFHAAVERDPVEVRRARNAAKSKNEAVRHSRTEERFRRPGALGAVEFRRRSRFNGWQAWGRDRDAADGSRAGRGDIVMRIGLHDGDYYGKDSR